MNKKLIRKMQTAAGGPLRIKFTPEQIALFESQATKVLGMNNSGGNRYREEGVLALQHLEQEAKRKEEEIKSRMEMHPTLKRKATPAEKLRGKKDEYELRPQIVGMSGADPLLSFYVGGVGLNGIGALAKTGLWNIAKYAPTTQLGNWGRGYFVGNAFKNSFNGTVPTITSQATSLLYLPTKLNETGLTSLKFFERKSAKKPLSQTERQGMTKGDRNLPEPSFKSELNWSPEDWFEKTAGRKYKDGSLTQYTDKDIKELNSHIPEYLEIEGRSKKNGTWLKTEDGSNWYGDPRSWVLMLSKNLKLHDPEDFWTGIHNSENFLKINSINPEYNGQIWGVYGQKFLSAAKARTYAPNDNFVFHMVSSKKAPTVVYDALGKSWYDIGGRKVGNQYITGKTTNEIINDNFSKGIERVKINNVSDTGPNKIRTNSKYSTGDFMLDWETLNSPGVHQNDIILSPGSFRKSLIGNNGAFNPKENMYRGLIPLTTGYTLYNLLNQPLLKLQYQKQGGKMNKIRKMLTASRGPINYKRWDDAKITSYTIPYIKEKVVKLTNAGKATGAKLSTNLLDSIADNAYRAKLPIRKALGIAFKESTFGNPTDDKSAWNLSSKIRELFNGEYPGTYLHINNGHTVLGQHLINYHKGDINHEVFYEGNPDAHKSIILEAFEFYKQHPDKYNPGQKNYQLLIDKLGDEAMQSPEILKWYEEWEKSKAQIFRPEPYKINTNIQNTVQEFVPHNKQGGKMNVLEFLKNGGQVRKMQTAAGGPIFIPAVLGSKLRKKLNNLYLYSKSYLLNKFIGPGKGEVIDLSKRKVSRIKRNTSNVSSILTNEFVEKNNNVIRKKKDFVNTTDTLLGDNKIPLSKISTFYGIENGKLKAGPLKIFNDTTTIIPNRAKYVGKVKEFYPGKNNSEKYNKVINEAMNRYNIDHGYFPSIFDKIFGLTHPTRVLRNNVSSKDYFGILEQLHNKYKHLEDGKDAYVITENNDTIKNYDLNATPKTLFADENGNAIFVANPHNHVKEINKMLLLHPMYPVMVDNGRYSAYLTQSPNAEIYSGFNDPNDMFLLGTISKRQGGMLELLKKGLKIHIKKKNRGKFTDYCGGKVTDECIRKAKASGNPTLVKRATFAANARKWKHLEGGQIKIPKNRTLVRTIKINNGILTAERDSNDNLHWFRNGKYITPNLIKTYKFYDPLLKAYRLLTNYYNEYVDRKTVGTKVYTPNLNIIRAKALKADRQKMLNNINQSVPFNGEKITLRTKGKMNLADIPTNLLDSIAINSGRSNTDFFTNSALVGKESTFGGFSKALGNPIPKEHKEQPWHITNNTAYFNNDYSAYNNAFENNRKPGDKVLLRDEANAKYALEHGLIEGKVPLYSNYVLADAFKRYSLNPSRYNPGQSNYALMVNGIKQELMEEKQFLNYWNTRGKEFYNKGKKETMKKGGIIKAQFGTNLNVDNLSDTTRKGWGKLPYFGAANNSNTAGLWDLLNYNVTKDPNVVTGAPEILPGRMNKGVLMIEKYAPKLFELINKFPSTAKNIVNGSLRQWKEFFRTGNKELLKSFETKAENILGARSTETFTLPKGFTKGNEVAPTSGTQSISETGLSVRDTKLGNMNNPPANPSEKIAVEDWNKMNPDNQISSKLPTGRPSYELELDGLKIDIRYPKQALPLLLKLNSPILKLEQRAPKKTASERYQERKETPSRNQRKKDSYNLTYEDGDVRHTNSGNRGIGIALDKEDWEVLGKYSTFAKRHHNIELRLSKHAKGTPAYKQAWKERKALILEYREKFRFRLKKGGKAFINGVNVLDSNSKMSKAASRRVKKADDGTKLNAFLKVENFFNSDTGKAIGNTLMNGLSAGFQAKQMNDAINEYELASKAKLKKIMNGISAKDYYDQVLLQMNPNENLSLVVLNTRAYALALLDALKKVNEAKDESALQLNKIKQFASEQNLYNLSNVLGGISLLGSLLNNKPASKVDNGTPSNSYFDNYANNYTKQLFNIKS